jgi:hypothetical protein
MPVRCMTAWDARLSGTVNDTTSSSPASSNAKRRDASAASVAIPSPHQSAASRQPTSTQGSVLGNGGSNDGVSSPTNPTNGAAPRGESSTSTAHAVHP